MIIFTSVPAAARPAATAAAKPANSVKHAAPKAKAKPMPKAKIGKIAPKPKPMPKAKTGKILNKNPYELENDIIPTTFLIN